MRDIALLILSQFLTMNITVMPTPSVMTGAVIRRCYNHAEGMLHYGALSVVTTRTLIAYVGSVISCNKKQDNG